MVRIIPIRKVIFFRRAKAIYWATNLHVNKKDHQNLLKNPRIDILIASFRK